MKSTLLVTIAALAAGCARPAYVAKSDAENACMHGSIKQIRETFYDSPADAVTLPGTLGEFDTYTVLDYNRAGNITQMEIFKGHDSVQIVKEEYLYDPSGKLMERSLAHDLNRHRVTTVIYERDNAGRLVSEIESNGLYRFDQGYDRHGYLKTRSTTSPATGKQVVIANYYYNRNGRLKKLKGERPQKYRYHPDGVLAEIREGRNEIDFYDEHGNLTAMSVRVKRRNQKGRVFERFAVTLSAEYELDTRENWIRRVQLYKGQVQSVTVREIGYYQEEEDRE